MCLLPYFVSVHAWKLVVLCVCVVLNNEDVMRGAQNVFEPLRAYVCESL